MVNTHVPMNGAACAGVTVGPCAQVADAMNRTTAGTISHRRCVVILSAPFLDRHTSALDESVREAWRLTNPRSAIPPLDTGPRFSTLGLRRQRCLIRKREVTRG